MADPNAPANPIVIPESEAAERYKRRGQLCEILFVLAITAGVAFIAHGLLMATLVAWEVSLGLILIAAAAGLFFLAVRYAARLNEELRRLSQDSKYLISPLRIATLEHVKAPTDVTKFLTGIQSDSQLFSRDELLSRMGKALGAERTNEVKDIVFRYTRVDEKYLNAEPE